MALQRPHHLNWLDPGKTHTFQLIQLIRPTPNTHISTSEHLKMFTTVFLSFSQFFYSSETGYAIQHALQLVRKQKYFPKDWAACHVNFSKHLWTHSWMTGSGRRTRGKVEKLPENQPAKELNAVGYFSVCHSFSSSTLQVQLFIFSLGFRCECLRSTSLKIIKLN